MGAPGPLSHVQQRLGAPHLTGDRGTTGRRGHPPRSSNSTRTRPASATASTSGRCLVPSCCVLVVTDTITPGGGHVARPPGLLQVPGTPRTPLLLLGVGLLAPWPEPEPEPCERVVHGPPGVATKQSTQECKARGLYKHRVARVMYRARAGVM